MSYKALQVHTPKYLKEKVYGLVKLHKGNIIVRTATTHYYKSGASRVWIVLCLCGKFC